MQPFEDLNVFEAVFIKNIRYFYSFDFFFLKYLISFDFKK
jgi:hypothetical protein